MSEIVGPFTSYMLVVDGYSVPFVDVRENDGGTVTFIMDDRLAWTIPAGSFEDVAHLIATAYALGLGLPCAPRTSTSTGHAHDRRNPAHRHRRHRRQGVRRLVPCVRRRQRRSPRVPKRGPSPSSRGVKRIMPPEKATDNNIAALGHLVGIADEYGSIWKGEPGASERIGDLVQRGDSETFEVRLTTRSPESYEREIRSLESRLSEECANSYRISRELAAAKGETA